MSVERAGRSGEEAHAPGARVTAVITTKDRSALLRRAVDSVLGQSLRDIEILVVDDGSRDDTAAMIRGISDARVRLIRHEEPRGSSVARNSGWREAATEWVAYLDDDDAWLPDKLERQLALAEGLPDRYAVVYCGATAVTEDGTVIGEAVPRIRGDIREHIVARGLNTISSSHLFRRAALDRIGGYDETLRSNNEHDIWMSLGKHGYSADYVEASLVVAWQHRGARLTEEVAPRVRAVKQYLGKWSDDLDEWMGRAAGRKYRERYFASVIGSLVASNVAAGNFRLARQALREVYAYSDERLYNIYIVARKIAAQGARRLRRRRGGRHAAVGT